MFLVSCQSNTDLSKLTLKEDVDSLITDRNDFYREDVEPASGLASIYTYKIDGFSFGEYDLLDNSETAIANKNSLTFYLEKPFQKSNNQIVGFFIKVNNSESTLFNVVESLYGRPEELSQKPTSTYEEILYGSESWLWKDQEMTIIVSKSYGSRNDKQVIDESIYLVRNDVMERGKPNRTAANRLIETFKN